MVEFLKKHSIYKIGKLESSNTLFFHEIIKFSIFRAQQIPKKNDL